MTKEELLQKIKDAPNIWMKRKYMRELQELEKGKRVSLLGTSKMIIKKNKPTII